MNVTNLIDQVYQRSLAAIRPPYKYILAIRQKKTLTYITTFQKHITSLALFCCQIGQTTYNILPLDKTETLAALGVTHIISRHLWQACDILNGTVHRSMSMYKDALNQMCIAANLIANFALRQNQVSRSPLGCQDVKQPAGLLRYRSSPDGC